jgi:hypothetical protein
MFGDRGGKGAPCAEQTNNGHGSTFADKYFQSNTCVQPVAAGAEVPAYEFASCKVTKNSSSVKSDTVWGTADNRFLVSRGAHVVVPCGGKSIPLVEWQHKYGQDQGASVGEIPPIQELMNQARGVLGL